MMLPGTAAIPAVHADRLRAAEARRHCRRDGSQGADPRPNRHAGGVENALRVLLALGGSTNAIIHLAAIAGPGGHRRGPSRLNQLSDATPVLVDLKPTGPHYMEDLFAAGGIGAVLRELRAAAPPRLRDGHRRDARRAPGRRRRTGSTGASSARSPSRFRSRAGWSRCSARWRRAAPSSSARRRARSCSSTRAARWCSPLSRTWRRASTIPISTCRRRHPGAAERRPEQPHRHARGRLPADPGQARPLRRQGHDAHLRRAHERHRLRHRRAARHARRRQRRPARPGPQRRPHPPQRGGAAPRSPGRRGRAGRAPRGDASRLRNAATPGCTGRRCSRPTSAAISTSCATHRRDGAEGAERPRFVARFQHGYPPRTRKKQLNPNRSNRSTFTT